MRIPGSLFAPVLLGLLLASGCGGQSSTTTTSVSSPAAVPPQAAAALSTPAPPPVPPSPAAMQSAASRTPTTPPAPSFMSLRNEGIELVVQERHAEALKVLTQALALQSQDGETWFWMLKAYQGLGDKPNALAAAKKAASLNSGNPMGAQAQQYLSESRRPAAPPAPAPAAAAPDRTASAPPPQEPPREEPPAVAAAPAPASIRGTLVYYFNDNYGDKPDTGARIWLIPGSFPPIGKSKSRFLNVMKQSASQTVADGQGAFAFTGLAPGRYTIVIQSSHTKDDSDAGPGVAGRLYQETVTLSAGQTVDVSHDFGMTYW